MKKIVIFNPSFEGGGVERNIKLIFKNLNKKLVNKINSKDQRDSNWMLKAN